MNKESVILITSHLNSEEKINVFKENISEIKKFTNIPIIHATNNVVDLETQGIVDYTIQKNNPKTNRFSLAWNLLRINGSQFKFIKKNYDHGYAHIDLMLYGFKVAKTIGFKYIYHLNYDVFLNEREFNEFIDNGKNGETNFYKYKLKNEGIKITTVIFSIKVDDFINAVDCKIQLYNNNENKFNLREGWLAEEFFEWIFNTYYGVNVNPKEINYTDVIRSDWNNKIYIKNIEFNYYVDIKNKIVYFVDFKGNNINYDIILYNVKNKEDNIKLKKMVDNVFYVDLFNGVYNFDDENYVEISKDTHMNYFVEKN